VCGVDYHKFKLFQLSILWRAGVSKNEMFKQVSLHRHEQIVRQRLALSDPGNPREYGCLMFALINDGRPVEDFILEPSWCRIDGHYCYRFIFGGLAWVFLVSRHAKPTLVLDRVLQENGQMTIRCISPKDMKFLVEFSQKLVESGKI